MKKQHFFAQNTYTCNLVKIQRRKKRHRQVIHRLSDEQLNIFISILGNNEPKKVHCFYRMYKDGILFQLLQYSAVSEQNKYTVIFYENDE